MCSSFSSPLFALSFLFLISVRGKIDSNQRFVRKQPHFLLWQKRFIPNLCWHTCKLLRTRLSTNPQIYSWWRGRGIAELQRTQRELISSTDSPPRTKPNYCTNNKHQSSKRPAKLYDIDLSGRGHTAGKKRQNVHNDILRKSAQHTPNFELVWTRHNLKNNCPALQNVRPTPDCSIVQQREQLRPARRNMSFIYLFIYLFSKTILFRLDRCILYLPLSNKVETNAECRTELSRLRLTCWAWSITACGSSSSRARSGGARPPHCRASATLHPEPKDACSTRKCCLNS